MAKQQTKRRRKRYAPGSAYAGHVRPRGIFSIFGNVRLFFIMGALIMLGSLGVGGIFGSGLFGNNNPNAPTNFVEPPEESTGTPEASATIEVKQYAVPPAFTIDPAKHYVATIKTALGDIQVELFDDQVPQTVNNFVFLARDGFYNGLIFHRTVEEFTAQAGDPACQAGASESLCRGSGGPGYDIDPETPATPVAYEPGTLGMANASQFFIALTKSDEFDQFTPFGRVVSGMDVAERLARGTAIQSIEIQEQ